MPKKKNVVLGVTGGIAAYKACSLVRILIKEGADVRVIMTESATRFLDPLTFQTLSGNPVYVSLFQDYEQGEIIHISLAKWADLVAIVPATANMIGKIYSGIADDLLSTVIMALPGDTKVVVGPAMNVEMWNNPVVQRNIEYLKSLNRYQFIEPVDGELACKDVGKGKLADIDAIAKEIQAVLRKR